MIQTSNSHLSIKEVASLYGEEINYKWLDLSGDNWLDKYGIVNASLLKEIEQGSVKECYVIENNSEEIEIKEFAKKFLENVNNLSKKGEKFTNKTLDYLFFMLDDLLTSNKFQYVDEIIKQIDVCKTRSLILLAVLNITSIWKELLNERAAFYDNVEKIIKKEYKKKISTELLYILK